MNGVEYCFAAPIKWNWHCKWKIFMVWYFNCQNKILIFGIHLNLIHLDNSQLCDCDETFDSLPVNFNNYTRFKVIKMVISILCVFFWWSKNRIFYNEFFRFVFYKLSKNKRNIIQRSKYPLSKQSKHYLGY